jgi:hypothetical protein
VIAFNCPQGHSATLSILASPSVSARHLGITVDS